MWDCAAGIVYPTLIRKYEPKPLRIFLQDGSNDLNIYAGDWWMANQTMERALTFAGYEVKHVWGEGGHSGKHGTAIFPDAMRWLWKDWPQPVKAGQSKNTTLEAILLPGEDWQLVGEGYKFTEGPAANAKGEVVFNDVPNSKTYKIGLDGQVSVFLADSKKANGQAFGPDGRLYAVASGDAKHHGLRRRRQGHGHRRGDRRQRPRRARTTATSTSPTPPAADRTRRAKSGSSNPNGEKQVVDTGLRFANGITLSPDQTLLYVADYRSHWIYSYQIQADGSLAFKQRYYWLHVPDNEDDTGADGLRVDRDGRLYVATRLGVQVCDQPGRVNASCRRRTARCRTSVSAAKTSTPCSPPAGTRFTSGS